MSGGQSRKPEMEVAASGNALSQLLLRTAAVALIPATLTFVWLGLLREPSVQAKSTESVANIAVQARANLVQSYAADVVARVNRLAQIIPPSSPAGPLDLEAMGFPEAVSITVIPLDELGTVNIELGQHGITSHIGIDVVRRAFAGEDPYPEYVTRPAEDYVLVAQSYGEPRAGVVLVRLEPARLSDLVNSNSPEGHYNLVQRSSSGTEVLVLGDKVTSGANNKAAVQGTPWQIRFSPATDWLATVTPSWAELAIAVCLSLGGILAGMLIILRQVPALIKQEADHILESADLRTPLNVRRPVLLPLAKMIRQLSLLNRRQLVTNARREATQEEQREPTSSSPIESAVSTTPTSPNPAAREEQADKVAEDAAEFDESIPAHIFRAACIRGDVDTELTDEIVEKIGNALAVMAGERGIQTLAIAHDSRPSSKRIRTTLVKALLSSGRDIIDIGEVPTPLLHFATHDSETKSGIMITGGHSPQNLNGLKIIFDRNVLSGSGIDALLDRVRSGQSNRGAGRLAKQNVVVDYLDKIATDVVLALPLRIIIDNDFGTSAKVAPSLFSALDCDVNSINGPDEGPRPSDRSLTTALEELGNRVRDEGADLGVLFDSDGDRLHTVTNAGTPVTTDQLLMILARDMLERNPGADIVYDVKFSRNFAPFVTRAGGRAQMSRSGAAFVREKMQQISALLAADFSGHIFFEERWFGFSDAMYALARLLEILAGESHDYEALVADLPKGMTTPEVYVPVDERMRRKIMRGLLENPDFPGAKVTTLDGLRVDYADGWGLVRGSTTDAALNLRFEGNDETSLARVRNVIYKAIHNIEPELELPG